MQAHSLAACVAPALRDHPGIAWEVLPAADRGDLVVRLTALGDPSRGAVVRVLAGAEVFLLNLAGHESADFAYEDEDRVEALEGRLALAVRALTGPTRVRLTTAGGRVIRSEMVFDPEGPQPEADTGASWPLRRLRAFLLRRRPVVTVLDLPRLPSQPGS